MRSGKKPTRKQKQAIKSAGLNYKNWLVVRNLHDELHIAHRETGTIRIIPQWEGSWNG